ncbi:PAS domain S-box-containing protein [Jatrophihabitans endophyticus]|uniref:PAS domain S-box-containing protein n=1 Tax=Jatrophihabitans endophyticus TaxID=1206085 RepID=A0A1M5IWX6_9ACTN|nr:EAL domain-containing protein [Jatrophihabitans endophyticus]SHG32796.1 PAS domain S-box-containing protein [Jatrophihabitans endophyticus]
MQSLAPNTGAGAATGRRRPPLPDVRDALRELVRDDAAVRAVLREAVAFAAVVAGRPMAAVSVVDADRTSFLAEVGPVTRHLSGDAAFCRHALDAAGIGLDVADAMLDDRFRHGLAAHGGARVRAYTGVPLLTGDRSPVGTLCVLDTEPGSLTDDQRDTLRSLARIVATVLRPPRPARGLARGLAGRRAAPPADAPCAAAARQLRELFATTPCHLVLSGREGVIRSANPAFARLIGAEDSDLRGRDYLDLVVRSDRAAESLPLGDARAVTVRELRLLPSGGIEQQVRVASSPIHTADGTDGNVLHGFERIAVLRTAEIEFRESRSALDAIVTVDRNERIVSWNGGAGRLLGHDRDAIIGKQLAMIVPPDDRPAHSAGFARLVGGGEPVLLGRTVELEALHADGSLVPVELSLSRWQLGTEWFYTAVLRDITERRRADREGELWRSLHDATTGLGNLAALRQWWSDQCGDGSAPGAVFSLRLTNLGLVTTALGADVGGELLAAVGAALTAVQDANLYICHLGDGHFAGAARSDEHTDPAEIRARLDAMARRAVDAATGPFEVAGVPVEMHARIGVLAASASEPCFTELLRHAEATREASPRRVNIACERGASSGPGLDDLHLVSEFRGAIAAGQLELHYQPVTPLQTEQYRDPARGDRNAPVDAVEALVRWRHPTRGFVPPDRFIPLIETGPLISVMTRWVLGEALAQQHRWRSDGLDVVVAVNLSPQVLLEDDVVTLVSTALAESAGDPSRLKLEITESAIVADPDEARDVVLALRQLGVAVSLDDFGIGYTSLRLLRDLRVDEIKLDRLFVKDATTNPADAAIASAVAQLAHRLAIRTVAEGIEDEETRNLFRALGFDYMQGYLESRPLPADAATAWLVERTANRAVTAPASATDGT